MQVTGFKKEEVTVNLSDTQTQALLIKGICTIANVNIAMEVKEDGYLYQGYWEHGHNRDWEEDKLRKATASEKTALLVIEDIKQYFRDKK